MAQSGWHNTQCSSTTTLGALGPPSDWDEVVLQHTMHSTHMASKRSALTSRECCCILAAKQRYARGMQVRPTLTASSELFATALLLFPSPTGQQSPICEVGCKVNACFSCCAEFMEVPSQGYNICVLECLTGKCGNAGCGTGCGRRLLWDATSGTHTARSLANTHAGEENRCGNQALPGVADAACGRCGDDVSCPAMLPACTLQHCCSFNQPRHVATGNILPVTMVSSVYTLCGKATLQAEHCSGMPKRPRGGVKWHSTSEWC